MDVIPGLKGFGTDTRAAYGGTGDPEICIVTNLTNANGDPADSTRNLQGGGTINVKEGSFKQCIEAQYPRVILFEVSGYITAYDTLRVRYPYCFIAGQTSPSPGITLKGATFVVYDHDIVVQHLRSRVGDNRYGPFPDYRDAITASTTADIYNAVVDHCSMSWATDEVAGGGHTNITWSNNIIGEGLAYSIHSKGEHSKGFMVTGTRFAGVNNFIISCGDRTPYFSRWFFNGVWSNNYTYNAKVFGINAGALIDDVFKISAVGNYNEAGPNSGSYATNFFMSIIYEIYNGGIGSEMYLNDNKCTAGTQVNADDWALMDNRNNVNDISNFKVLTEPTQITGFTPISSSLIKEHVLSHAGARPIDRDAVDIRYVTEANAGTGSIKSCVESGTIYYPTGFAVNASTNTIVLEALTIDPNDDRYNGQTISIVGGTGNGQSRTISDWVKTTRTAVVSSTWDTIPDTTSEYRIHNVCTNDAGGWPTLAENVITLEIPTNPHVDSGDGYTNLEKWLHTKAAEVEGTSSSHTKYSRARGIMKSTLRFNSVGRRF